MGRMTGRGIGILRKGNKKILPHVGPELDIPGTIQGELLVLVSHVKLPFFNNSAGTRSGKKTWISCLCVH